MICFVLDNRFIIQFGKVISCLLIHLTNSGILVGSWPAERVGPNILDCLPPLCKRFEYLRVLGLLFGATFCAVFQYCYFSQRRQVKGFHP